MDFDALYQLALDNGWTFAQLAQHILDIGGTQDDVTAAAAYGEQNGWTLAPDYATWVQYAVTNGLTWTQMLAYVQTQRFNQSATPEILQGLLQYMQTNGVTLAPDAPPPPPPAPTYDDPEFDDLMNRTATVYRRMKGTPDAHGSTPVALVAGETFDARVSTYKSRPKEWMAEKKGSRDYLVVFCRPQTFAITEHDFLAIGDGAATLDIVNVLNIEDHHLEITCEVRKP